MAGGPEIDGLHAPCRQSKDPLEVRGRELRDGDDGGRTPEIERHEEVHVQPVEPAIETGGTREEPVGPVQHHDRRDPAEQRHGELRVQDDVGTELAAGPGDRHLVPDRLAAAGDDELLDIAAVTEPPNVPAAAIEQQVLILEPGVEQRAHEVVAVDCDAAPLVERAQHDRDAQRGPTP
jgi:hypothetical protein